MNLRLAGKVTLVTGAGSVGPGWGNGRAIVVRFAQEGVKVLGVDRLAGQRTGGDVEELLKQRQARGPLPFMRDGRDTANVARFLASDEARFITGTELVVDGGMSARCG